MMRKTRINSDRNGSTLVVVCILLGIIMVAIAFSVDFARIQLTQLELQSAADLSCRAGAESLSRGVGDPNDLALTDAAIRDEILMVGRLNTVNGNPINLAATEIQFGRADVQATSVDFVPTATGEIDATTDSVRVNPGIDNYPITFGKFVGRQQIDLETRAAAMIAERDIVVVLDRSTSMTSRDAGTIAVGDYPANLLSLEQQLWAEDDPYHPSSPDFRGFGPDAHPGYAARDVLVDIQGGNVNLTRLQALRIAVQVFVQEIEASKGAERLGLSTYGFVANAANEGQSVIGGHDYDIVNGLTPAETMQLVGTGTTDDGYADHQSPTQKYASALEGEESGYAAFKLNYLSMRWSEWTHIVDGIEKGVDILFGPGSRPLATPVLIVMTDGNHNQSGTPNAAAQNAMAAHPDLLIYTVTFGVGADQPTMQTVAATGNAIHHHASDVTQLVDVFRDLAQNAGVTLIE